ncbi:hypothetical protein EDB19DRAFT_1829379 [Suillus lakei]|nr:hypothetical protein EDB19DRAFT_1829379 [Suillus lakei]
MMGTNKRPRAIIVVPTCIMMDGLRMTVMDLMLRSISNKVSMLPWREVTDEVDAEMEAAKDISDMSSKDVTPELLPSFDLDALLTARLRETTMWLRRILLSAMQTARATKENKKQNIEMVLSESTERTGADCKYCMIASTSGTIGICQISNSSLPLPNFSEIDQPGFATRLYVSGTRKQMQSTEIAEGGKGGDGCKPEESASFGSANENTYKTARYQAKLWAFDKKRTVDLPSANVASEEPATDWQQITSDEGELLRYSTLMTRGNASIRGNTLPVKLFFSTLPSGESHSICTTSEAHLIGSTGEWAKSSVSQFHFYFFGRFSDLITLPRSKG